MANAGYKVKVELSDDDTTYVEVDGIKSFNIGDERVELDITDFKTVGILREKLMGLRDMTFSISGDYVDADPGQELFLAAADSTDDNPILWLRVLFNGVAGVKLKVTAASSSISGEVEGLVAFEASGSLNGSFARV